MEKKIKILHLEDVQFDAELVAAELIRAKMNPEILVVHDKAKFLHALKDFSYDVILSDHSLVSFDSHEALRLVKKAGITVPFILVTAAMTDEFAVKIMKEGAYDYILKDRLSRLPSAIINSIEKHSWEEQQRAANERLAFHIENTPLGFIEWDNQLHIKALSKQAEEIFGWGLAEFSEHDRNGYSQVYEEDLPIAIKAVQDLMTGVVQRNTIQHRNITKDGRVIWCEWFNSVLKDKDGKVVTIMSLVQDITAHKVAEEKLNKANRLYTFISQVNQSIVRIKDEQELFRTACSIAFEFGKFKIAWIGLFNKLNNEISIVGQNGMPGENLKQFKNIAVITGGPQEYVLRSGKYFCCNDIANEPELEGWKSLASKYGINSCMVLPVKKSGNIIGTFNLYSNKLNFFDTEEIALLLEATGDISFALDTFEKEKAHRHTEELVVQNEKRFRSLIEKGSDMITLAHPDGELIYVSASVTKMLGYSAEELLHMSVFDFVHPDDIPGVMKNRDEVVLTPGKSIYYQHRRRHKNGSWMWCEGTLTNMLHEPGINALASNFRDVTEKKLAEEGLLLTQFAIDSAGDAVFWMTADAQIVKVNEAACTMLGYSQPEMVQLSVPDIDPDFNAKKWRVHYEELRQKGSLFFETIQQAKDGRLIPVEISANYIKFGDAEYNCAFSRDISERKIAEGNLVKSETKLKEAQAIAHIGNFEIDLINFSEVWSDEMYVIIGISKEDATASTELFLSVIHPDDLDYVQTGFERCSREFENCTFDFRFVRKDGIARYGYTKARFEFDRNKKPVRLFGVFQDVTEVKLAELERLKMVNDLMVRNAELEQFGYIISHNLRAPVANIIGASSALIDPDLSAEDKQILKKGINTSVIKLDSVIKDLNQILEVKGKISEPKEIVHFSKLVDDIKFSIENMIDKDAIEIKCDFSEVDEFLTLRAYLYSIFYNIISNSIKYRRQQAQCLIEIKSRLEKNRLELIFTDNGSGIDLKKNGDDVFGLYKRFHNHIEGKGMGLFMVKTQVETLGGKISIKSAENKGTEFKIEFEV